MFHAESRPAAFSKRLNVDGLARSKIALGRRLQGEIVAKGRVVVDVLVAQRQSEHGLADHDDRLMIKLALDAGHRSAAAPPKP